MIDTFMYIYIIRYICTYSKINIYIYIYISKYCHLVDAGQTGSLTIAVAAGAVEAAIRPVVVALTSSHLHNLQGHHHHHLI